MGDSAVLLGRVWPGLVLFVFLAGSPDVRAQSGRRADRPGKSVSKPERSEGDDPESSSSDAVPPPKVGTLRMSRAVVCKTIDGYESYKPLPGAAQTSDEKLLIYYRPLRYKVEFVDGFYRAHLVQDNEVRRRGRKEIIRQKKKVVEYEPKSRQPIGPIYIRNTISLKGLEPGDYDLTIILRDELDESSPPTRQVVKFKVIPPIDPRKKARESTPTEDEPAPES